MKSSGDSCPSQSAVPAAPRLLANLAKTAMAFVFALITASAGFAQTVTWTDTFTAGQAPAASQCQNWSNFLDQLADKKFVSVTISGTFDQTGKSITDPEAANRLAELLSTRTPGSVVSGDHVWTVGASCGMSACGGLSLTLTVDGSGSGCDCSDTYALRPQATGPQWGGINTTNSCSAATQTMSLVFDSGVSVMASGPTTFCPGGSVVLTASASMCTGPLNYQWSNGAVTESITVSEPGDYSVTVTSADGCGGTSSATAVRFSEISVDAGEASVFCSEPVQLNALSVSAAGKGENTNKYCMFDAPGGAGNCSFPAGEDVCTGAMFYTTGSFSTRAQASNPSEVKFNIYYSAFQENTIFRFKVNGQEIGSYNENDASGACDTRVEGKFPKAFAFAQGDFLQYWNRDKENVLTVEVSSGEPGVYLAGITAEVSSSNETFIWSPAAGLSNASIANPLASPTEPTVYTVTYTDANGCTATDQVKVEVKCNTAPVAVCKPVVVPATENCAAVVDPSAFDGGSTSSSGGQLSFSVAPAGPYAVGETQVIFTVTDSNGESASCTTTVTVKDTTKPLVTVAGDISVSNDPGVCAAIVALTAPEVSDNCGIASISHDQTDDIFLVGETPVTWTVTDIHGNQTIATQKVIVTNSDPVINSVTASADVVEIGTPVSLTTNFTDNNARLGAIDWGDLSEPDFVDGPEESFTVTHTYSAAGTYTVMISVEDHCQASALYTYESITVVEKQPAYATGSGWFYSQPGYYLKKRKAEGKAQFQFEAETGEGSAPTGKIKFKFKAGKLQYNSSSLDRLVVDEGNAFLTGTGALNGAAGYGILISVVDVDYTTTEGVVTLAKKEKGKGKGNNKAKDRIRVKIWDAEGTVVYDTQLNAAEDALASAEIGGGSIEVGTKAEESEESEDAAGTLADLLAGLFGDGVTEAFPNPFIDWLAVRFEALTDEDVQFQLIDLTGKVVYSAAYEVQPDSSYSLEIPEGKGGKGIYLLKITQGEKTEFIRLVRE